MLHRPLLGRACLARAARVPGAPAPPASEATRGASLPAPPDPVAARGASLTAPPDPMAVRSASLPAPPDPAASPWVRRRLWLASRPSSVHAEDASMVAPPASMGAPVAVPPPGCAAAWSMRRRRSRWENLGCWSRDSRGDCSPSFGLKGHFGLFRQPGPHI